MIMDGWMDGWVDLFFSRDTTPICSASRAGWMQADVFSIHNVDVPLFLWAGWMQNDVLTQMELCKFIL